MASTYTSRIGLEKQGDGENANTWGLRLNQNTIDMVDEAVAGYETISIDALSSITLTSNDGTADQSRNFALRFTGNLSADCTVNVPATEKVYFINNETTGDQNVIIKSGTASETVEPGNPALIAFDGTNSIKLQNNDEFLSGTSLLFYQATAPVGWTKQVINDKAIRVVSGSGGSTGGSTAFSSVFTSRTPAGSVSGTVASHTLTLSQIPSHNHYSGTSWGGLSAPDAAIFGETTNSSTRFMSQGSSNSTRYPNTSSSGGGGSHNHGWSGSFSGSAMDFAVQYADVIICTKD